MIKYLKTTNIGPAKSMELEFAERINVLTGDNGLGKSFILDIAWWALTRRWPAEINNNLTAGKKALPSNGKKAKISFSFTSKTKGNLEYESEYAPKEQAWTGKQGRPSNPGIVLYAMSDGSFAVWDPARNYWTQKGKIDVQERLPAYVFSPQQVWDGLEWESSWLCNGLLRDWAGWQKESKAPFKHLKEVLKTLSPSDNERLKPGQLTRIDIDDSRDMPTITMPYGQDVPIVHLSAGMRRIMALAYFLVWAWEEHKRAVKLLGQRTSEQIVFLIDEIESHLHPTWQRRIIPSILSVMNELSKNMKVQLVTATHSPLIMSSLEPLFENDRDAWFDLDFEQDEVNLRKREFEKLGDANNWLTSEAFDLKSSRALEYEELIDKASALMDENNPPKESIQRMYDELCKKLSPKDDFLFRWRSICHKKGWLS